MLLVVFFEGNLLGVLLKSKIVPFGGTILEVRINLSVSFGCLGEFGQGSFAARSGILLEEAFFDSFVVLGLGFGHGLGGRIILESLESGLDIALDTLILSGALDGLTCGLFGGFNNRH